MQLTTTLASTPHLFQISVFEFITEACNIRSSLNGSGNKKLSSVKAIPLNFTGCTNRLQNTQASAPACKLECLMWKYMHKTRKLWRKWHYTVFHSYETTVCLYGNSACSTISLSLLFMLDTKSLQDNPALHRSRSTELHTNTTLYCSPTNFAGGVTALCSNKQLGSHNLLASNLSRHSTDAETGTIRPRMYSGNTLRK